MMGMKKFPKIKDVIPLTNGVFGHMSYTFPETISVTKEQLDFLFMSSFARRNPAPVIDLLHDEDEGEDEFSQLTDTELTKLASMMLAYYKPKWDKLGEIYSIEYDPIHNYLDEWEDEADGTKENHATIDRDVVDTMNYGTSHSNTRTDQLTEEVEYGKVETRMYGDEEGENALKQETEFGKSTTRKYGDENGHNMLIEETEFGKSTTRKYGDENGDNTLVNETEYGKRDQRIDNLTKTNSGEDSTINSGHDTTSLWGFNSNNPVNSDRVEAGTTARHVIGNPQGNNLLVETNTGGVTDILSGKDSVTTSGEYTDGTDGKDKVTTSGEYTDGTDGKDTVTTSGEYSDYSDGKDTKKNTGSQTNVGNDSTTGTNSRATDETDAGFETTNLDREGRHFGNIGNLTSQQMIKEEIELWKWNYIQSILEDARDFLTLPMYL